MNRPRRFRLRACLPLCLVLWAGPASGSSHIEAGQSVETRHYELAYDPVIPEEDAEHYGEVLEQSWKHFKSFMKSSPKLGSKERLAVALYADKESWLAGLRNEGAEPPAELDLLWFRPESGRLHLYVHSTRQSTRVILIYGAWQQFHGLLKTKHQDLTHTWFIRGLAEHFSFHRWDGKRLELGVDSFLRPARNYPKVTLERINGLGPGEGLPHELVTNPDVHYCLTRFLMEGENGRHRKRFEKLALGSDGSKLNGREYLGAISEPDELIESFRLWLRANQSPWEVLQGDWSETDRRDATCRPVGEKVAMALLDSTEDRLAAEFDTPTPKHAVGFILGYAGDQDFVVAFLREGELIVLEVLGGQERELARRLPATRKGRGADWKLEARREAGGDVSLSVNGDHAGTWQVPGPRLGLGVITGEAQFTAIAWD